VAVSSILLVLAPVISIGLLYSLRQARVFAVGPHVADALPLLQLAGFDGQPLLRVLVALLAVGMVVGLVMIRVRPSRRALIAGAVALPILLFASDASYALARNLRLTDVLTGHAPGLGSWVEALILAVGCGIVGVVPARWRASVPSLSHVPTV
jgi:hypothetical protein